MSYIWRMDHPRISQDPAVMGGKPCIKGTRIPVEIVLDHLAAGGGDFVAVLSGYPDLTPEDITAAIAAAAEYLRSDGFIAA
jgi:uncharacterized protein (DUF433 family)